MGNYTPGWLQWAAELPAPIGYVAAGIMIPSFLFVYVVIPADIEGPSEQYNTDSFGSVIKGILSALCILVIGFVCMVMCMYIGISFVVVLFTVAIEWICYKIYLLKLLKWISEFFFYILYLPVYMMIQCYSHSIYFLCFVLVIMLLYCFKHARKSCEDTRINEKLLEKKD